MSWRRGVEPHEPHRGKEMGAPVFIVDYDPFMARSQVLHQLEIAGQDRRGQFIDKLCV